MYLGNTYKYSTSRREHTTDSNYWTGVMGWGNQDLNTVFGWGSGFWDSWDTPGNRPSSSSTHWVGLNAVHYATGSSARYGWQMTMGAGNPDLLYVRGQWGTSPSAWRQIIHSGNIASQSVSNANTVDGYHIVYGSTGTSTSTLYFVP